MSEPKDYDPEMWADMADHAHQELKDREFHERDTEPCPPPDGMSYHDETEYPELKPMCDGCEGVHWPAPGPVDPILQRQLFDHAKRMGVAAATIMNRELAKMFEAKDKTKCPNCDGTGQEAVPMLPAWWHSLVQYATCGFCGGDGEAK